MKITCDVIKDLLPLYIEDISSDDTRSLVEEHIISCDSCMQELRKLSTPKEFVHDTAILPMKRLRIALLKRKYLTILFSVLITILVLIISLGYITAPEYIPYENNPITITEAANQSVIVHFQDPGTRYEIDKYSSDDNSGYIYTISLWNSTWNRMVYHNPPQDFILNPSGEAVASVYYSSNDGTEDTLIFGKDQNPTGGVITLPRLVLSYYVSIAVVAFIILGSMLFFFKNKQNVNKIIFKIFALPLSYLLGHLCIKGLSTISYSATRDFFAILLAMLPIYCIILIGYSFLRTKMKK